MPTAAARCSRGGHALAHIDSPQRLAALVRVTYTERVSRRPALAVSLPAPLDALFVMRRCVPFCVPLAALALSACTAQRKLVIESDPPGALVRLDDTIVGTTPYERSFDAYGTRRVTLYRAGYRPATDLIVVAPPWYAAFPIDVFTEVLVPVGWSDIQSFEFKLEPESGEVTVPDLNAVLERAESLRLAEPSGPRPSTIPPPAPPRRELEVD